MSPPEKPDDPYVGRARGRFSVVVTGGTGFIGRALVRAFDDAGWPVTLLTRDPARAAAGLPPCVRAEGWDGRSEGAWEARIDGADAVVNLAGKGIFESRWSDAVKAEIAASRVGATEILARAIERAKVRPKVYVGASAIGFYGPRGDEEIDESAAAGEDFLARTCVKWEEAHRRIEALGVRVVLPRIGVVLGPDPGLFHRLVSPIPPARAILKRIGFPVENGGALPQLMPPVPFCALRSIGTGTQWFSWIHREDLVGMIRWAIESGDVKGVLNATAPEPVTMVDFLRVLAEVQGKWRVATPFGSWKNWLRRFYFLQFGEPPLGQIPAWLMRLLAGEVAEILLTGQRVFPRAATAAGFTFRHPSCEGALRDLLGRPAPGTGA